MSRPIQKQRTVNDLRLLLRRIVKKLDSANATTESGFRSFIPVAEFELHPFNMWYADMSQASEEFEAEIQRINKGVEGFGNMVDVFNNKQLQHISTPYDLKQEHLNVLVNKIDRFDKNMSMRAHLGMGADSPSDVRHALVKLFHSCGLFI